MTSRISFEVKATVIALRAQHFSYPKILESLSAQGIQPSYSTVERLCTEEEKRRDGWTKPEKRLAPQNLPSVRSKENINKVKKALLKRNPEALRKVSCKPAVSLSTIGRIVHENLGLKVRKKQRVHILTDIMKQQRYDRAKFLSAEVDRDVSRFI